MASLEPAVLAPYARKYLWWLAPDEAARQPQRVIAQVMNLGDYADVQKLAKLAGDAVLVQTLNQAQAGQFTPRSWAYWHYRLGLAELDRLPPLPQRVFA